MDTPMYRVSDKEVWYGWSFMFPTDFQLVENRLVIGQWKQATLNSQSPVVALRYVNGTFYHTVRNLTRDLEDEDEIQYIYGPLLLGTWNDVAYHIIWSENIMEGLVEGYVNETLAFSYYGQTIASGGGYVDTHIGLYRNQWPDPWTMYFDDFRVSNSSILS